MEPAGKQNNWYYNRNLKPLARALRKNMTKAEASLWKYGLKANKMNGFSFSRQRPVLNYIADFMCKELNLIIEVDGITHLEEEVKKQDAVKDKDLTEAGFTVLRYTDEQVLNRMDLVLKDIEKTIHHICR